MFDAMTTQILDEWNRTMTRSLKSTLQWAVLMGELMDQTARSQWNNLGLFFLANTRQIHQVLEMFIPHDPDNKLAPRIVLVTGGTRGSGRTICKELACYGNKVAATYLPDEGTAARRWQSDIRSQGYDVAIVECDPADFDSCAQMMEEIHSRLGAVDILINCAALAQDNPPKHKDYCQVLDAQLDSFFNVAKNVIDDMAQRHYGRIIHISSPDIPMDPPVRTSLSITKAGVLGFTKSLARELADQGITVNTISQSPSPAGPTMTIPEEWYIDVIGKHPLNRSAKPNEIVQAVIFLTAEENGSITGADIPVHVAF